MNLTDYENTGIDLYRKFAEAVATILEKAIDADGSIKVQQIQRRAKDPSSLRRKLENAGANPEGEIEDVAKDLAGCRLVLYSNSDVARLNNSRILFDNFAVVWERTKFHFPSTAEGIVSPQFIGDNYVIRLKLDRAGLVEFKPFAGLLCEVQVQTILNHAWSATAHDTIYKRPSLKGIGAKQMAGIDARINAIQEKYLLPAGYEFQKVLNDFERLAKGQSLIDADILSAIEDAQDNNDRVELLEQYENHVLEFLDDPASVVPDVRDALITCAQRSFVSAVKPIESPIGALPGHESADVVDKVLSILDRLRYVEPEQAFETLVRLYYEATDQAIREKVQASVSKLAEYELDVWRAAGAAVQEILLDAIAKTPPQRLSAIRPLMIEIGGHLLKPVVTGTSSTSRTFTWHTGAVEVTKQLASVRDRAMQMLMDLFQSSGSDIERRAIFWAMEEPTRLPHQGEYADALLIRVLQDTTRMVTFLGDQVDALPNDLAESVERDLFFLYQRTRGMPGNLLKDPEAQAERDKLIAAITSFRDRLNDIEDYVIFKTLVGFETVFLYEWETAELQPDIGEKDRYRNERVAELVGKVGAANADEWFERLNRYASIESNDLATFPS